MTSILEIFYCLMGSSKSLHCMLFAKMLLHKDYRGFPSQNTLTHPSSAVSFHPTYSYSFHIYSYSFLCGQGFRVEELVGNEGEKQPTPNILMEKISIFLEQIYFYPLLYLCVML